MKVTCTGLGYEGLLTEACFPLVAHKVACLDSDNKKIEKLQKGTMPIQELGLSEINYFRTGV